MEIKFDTLISEILCEKFGSPGKARRRFATPHGITSRDPNTWKDPLKKHHMGVDRSDNRKTASFVPASAHTEKGIMVGQQILNKAKDADSGIWEISLPVAYAIAQKYRFNIPNAKKKIKHLGSTGIVMYFKYDHNTNTPKLFLVKQDKFMRSRISMSKKMNKPVKGRATKGRLKTQIKRNRRKGKNLKRPKAPQAPVKATSPQEFGTYTTY